MGFDYSDRNVPAIAISGISRHFDEEGNMLVGGSVRFCVTSRSGDILGPVADISIAIPDEQKPLEDVEQDLLAASHAILKRLAAEPFERLPQALQENRRELQPPKLETDES